MNSDFASNVNIHRSIRYWKSTTKFQFWEMSLQIARTHAISTFKLKQLTNQLQFLAIDIHLSTLGFSEIWHFIFFLHSAQFTLQQQRRCRQYCFHLLRILTHPLDSLTHIPIHTRTIFVMFSKQINSVSLLHATRCFSLSLQC